MLAATSTHGNHARWARFQSQTQGEIGHWHLTMKHRVLLEDYYMPDDLDLYVEAFVD